MNLTNKQECMALVGHVVTSMQKWKSIYYESGKTGIYNIDIEKDGTYDKYLLAFMKMQDKGDELEVIDIVNLVYYVNELYPAIGIILAANGEDVPMLSPLEVKTLADTWGEK